MSVRVYRCMTDKLNIRTEPRASADKAGALRFNERVTVQTETRTANDGFVWIKHERGWSAERSLNGLNTYLTDNINGVNRARVWGINIDPDNPQATANPNTLKNVAWVRMVLHVESRGRTLPQSLAFYNNIVNDYLRNGVQVLFVLLQDTYAGNAPWVTDNTANGWRVYSAGFALRAREIARYFKGRIAAYQIWNESDVKGQPTSIFVDPAFYASLLTEVGQALALQDPAAQVISAGLAAGTGESLNYLKQVRTACGGVLPCDGVGLHPYGQIPNVPDAEPFPGWSTGSLEGTLIKFAEEFPGHLIYITEIGVPRIQDLNDQNIWARTASYMQKTAQYLRNSFAQSVGGVMWFAWSDSMDRAGITNFDQQPKGGLYNQFFAQVAADVPKLSSARTILAGRVGLFHENGDAIPDASLSEYARRIFTAAPNVRDVMLLTSRGSQFAGVTAGKTALAVRGEADLWRWAAAFATYRMDVHAWHKIQATTPGEIATEVKFVGNLLDEAFCIRSLVLDLDRAVRLTSANIRDYMLGLRRVLPTTLQIALTFDPDMLTNNAIADFAPFVQAWMPRLASSVNALGGSLQTGSTSRRDVPVPLIPVFQPGGEITQARVQSTMTNALETLNSPAIAYTSVPTFTEAEWLTVRSIGIPYTAGTRVVR